VWTLSEVRSKLSDRLGEDSIVFWEDADRDSYINEAQRLVSSITRGITSTAFGTVNTSTPSITLPNKMINGTATMGYVDGGRSLSIISVEQANLVSPNWRTQRGSPLWIILDTMTATARVTPIPTAGTTVYVTVSILPADMSADSDELFDGVDAMEQYQGAIVNFAASLALLKERYDGDAERFYKFAVQEMQQVGVNPQEIPPFREVATDA